MPSVETALAWAEGKPVFSRNRRTVLGTGAEVKEELEQVARLYGADELMLVNIMPDHAARVRNWELVAEAWGLASLSEAA